MQSGSELGTGHQAEGCREQVGVNALPATSLLLPFASRPASYWPNSTGGQRARNLGATVWDRHLGLREERAGGRDGEPTQQGQGPSSVQGPQLGPSVHQVLINVDREVGA